VTRGFNSILVHNLDVHGEPRIIRFTRPPAIWFVTERYLGVGIPNVPERYLDVRFANPLNRLLDLMPSLFPSSLRVFDLEHADNSEPIANVDGVRGSRRMSSTITPDAHWLVIAAIGSGVKFYECTGSGRVEERRDLAIDADPPIELSADGRVLYYVKPGVGVGRWDFTASKSLEPLKCRGDVPRLIVPVEDGRVLVAGGKRLVYSWDKDGNPLPVIEKNWRPSSSQETERDTGLHFEEETLTVSSLPESTPIRLTTDVKTDAFLGGISFSSWQSAAAIKTLLGPSFNPKQFDATRFLKEDALATWEHTHAESSDALFKVRLGEAKRQAYGELPQKLAETVFLHLANNKLTEAQRLSSQLIRLSDAPEHFVLAGVTAVLTGTEAQAKEARNSYLEVADAESGLDEFDSTVDDLKIPEGNKKALTATARIWLYPEGWNGWYERGFARLQQASDEIKGERQRLHRLALDDLEKGVALHASSTAGTVPDSAIADQAALHFRLGQTLRALKRLDEASAAFKQVLALQKDEPRLAAFARIYLGEALATIPFFNEAETSSGNEDRPVASQMDLGAAHLLAAVLAPGKPRPARSTRDAEIERALNKFKAGLNQGSSGLSDVLSEFPDFDQIKKQKPFAAILKEEAER